MKDFHGHDKQNGIALQALEHAARSGISTWQRRARACVYGPVAVLRFARRGLIVSPAARRSSCLPCAFSPPPAITSRRAYTLTGKRNAYTRIYGTCIHGRTCAWRSLAGPARRHGGTAQLESAETIWNKDRIFAVAHAWAAAFVDANLRETIVLSYEWATQRYASDALAVRRCGLERPNVLDFCSLQDINKINIKMIKK